MAGGWSPKLRNLVWMSVKGSHSAKSSAWGYAGLDKAGEIVDHVL